MKYAHTESGQALDPQFADSEKAYRARYSDEAQVRWTVVRVPDDTQHNALSNGDGTYANPTAAQVSSPSRIITRLAFKLRFATQERIAIRASADPVVFDFMDLLETAEEVNLADPELVAGVGYLEANGLIADGRALEILG